MRRLENKSIAARWSIFRVRIVDVPDFNTDYTDTLLPCFPQPLPGTFRCIKIIYQRLMLCHFQFIIRSYYIFRHVSYKVDKAPLHNMRVDHHVHVKRQIRLSS
jgi:hypothetical protein